MSDIDIEDGRESHRFRTRRPPSHRRRHRTSIPPKPLTFSQKLGQASLHRSGKTAPLFTDKIPRGDAKPRPTIRILPLQHMTVIHLRRVIAGYVAEIVETENAPPELMERVKKTMKQYTQAMRDLQYMLENPSHNKRVSKYMKDLLYMSDWHPVFGDGAIMADAGLLVHERERERNYGLYVPDYTGEGGYYDERAKAGEATQAFFGRLWMALFGGIVLIAPMLIMRLHPTLVTQLVTTSAFVLAFAVILARFMVDADKKDILSATAAYAAVLVVFVGTSN